MYNYKLLIEYDGKDFKGWQKQKYTDETVQGKLEYSIEKILKIKIKLLGSGRTDSGVSAFNQVANFKYPEKIDFKKFLYSVNSLLPDSITVKKISFVNQDFHSRYSAKKREYIYKTSGERKSIERDFYFKTNLDLDFKKMDLFFDFILKQNNFKSFCKNKDDRNNFLCKIYKINYKFIKSKRELIFSITANRFLHSMVRAIFGCSLEIGRNKINFEYLKEKIRKGDKINVYYLPANALFLNKIFY